MKKINSIIESINEKWVKGTKSNNLNKYREIFVNPSKKELQEIVKDARYDSIRFIADGRRKKIYVVLYDVFHYTLAEEIGMSESEFIYKTFAGMGDVMMRGVEVDGITDYLSHSTAYLERYVELGEEILNGDYDWMKRYHFYFPLEYLNWLRDEIEMTREELDY